MSQVDYSVHPGNPAAQPFQGTGRPNKTKKNSWWHPKSDSFWRNKAKKKDSSRENADKDSSEKKPRKFKKDAE